MKAKLLFQFFYSFLFICLLGSIPVSLFFFFNIFFSFLYLFKDFFASFVYHFLFKYNTLFLDNLNYLWHKWVTIFDVGFILTLHDEILQPVYAFFIPTEENFPFFFESVVLLSIFSHYMFNDIVEEEETFSLEAEDYDPSDEGHEDADVDSVVESFFGENDLAEEDEFSDAISNPTSGNLLNTLSREDFPFEQLPYTLLNTNFSLDSTLDQKLHESNVFYIKNDLILAPSESIQDIKSNLYTNDIFYEGFSEIFAAPGSEDPSILEKVFVDSDVPEELILLRFGSDNYSSLSFINFIFFRNKIFEPFLRFLFSLVPGFIISFFFLQTRQSNIQHSILFPLLYLYFFILELVRSFLLSFFLIVFFIFFLSLLLAFFLWIIYHL